ncbi:tetratricopeptide repeat protein [Yoonia sp. R2331]|uniref:tetratricopeptide repeat protein n=1 Tax=Yoonia sp. R2331 TaxID=3237238 RepID=UPI0034E3CB2A
MFKPIVRSLLLSGILCGVSPAWAEVDAGAYLAARQAAVSSDFAEGAQYYTKALISDPSNPLLLESAVTSFVALGQVDRAAPVAQVLVDLGIESQTANLVLVAKAAKSGDWMAIFDNLETGRSVSPLVDGLAQAWAAVGLGKMTQAIASFDEVIETEGMRSYGLYHKALALASVGDFEGADAIFGAPGQAPLTARAAIAHAQVLSQLDRNADALDMLDSAFGQSFDPGLALLRDRLTSGEALPFTIVAGPTEGFGEVIHMIAGLLRGEAQETYTIQYTRIAEYLDPTNTDAIMLSAALLQTMDQYELASETLARVPQSSPSFPNAEMARIDALRRLDRPDAAIEVAEALARTNAALPFVHSKLGDVLREQERYSDAHEAYSAALDLYGPEDPNRWLVLYARAITSHAQDDWPPAEADFRAALALRPDQPQVLNYLGYSLVERGEKLDEALEMIETAVAARPDNGAIVDSLGWVLFQLGRYEEAVVHMERAAALEAVDPIVNDHLGDVYWAVGRKIEAAFQWNRALSFDPDEELATRIRAKLEQGLDAVLAAEGAEPMTVANDDP